MKSSQHPYEPPSIAKVGSLSEITEAGKAANSDAVGGKANTAFSVG